MTQPYAPTTEQPHAALAVAQAQAGGDVLGVLGVLASADHLLATRLLCPRCERAMRWDWGWCPYHALPDELRRLTPAGTGGSGEVTREEFVALVEDERPYVGQSFADHLTSDLNSRNRLLVHYTEFLAARRPVIVSEDEA